MTKGKLASKFVWFVVIILFSVLFLAISAVVWDIKFLGNSATALWTDGTVNWGHALYLFYKPIIDVIINGFFNPEFITGMFSATYWSGITSDAFAFINYITVFLFLAIIIVYLIEFIINLVRVFTHHKPALLWNILWYAIIGFLMMYVVALLHLALFGSEATIASADWKKGAFFNYLAVTLFQRTGTAGVGNDYLNFANMQANGLTTAQVLGGWVMLVSFWVFMILALIAYIKGFVIIGRCIGYTRRHKYDYIVKREMKAKARYYKEHGFEGGKDRTYKDVEQNGALPYPYAQPNYGYPYGGNTVSTGNNAPLIVQYLNGAENSGDQGILNTRQPAIQVQNPQQGLTREDLKLAIMEVLNAQKGEQPQVVVNQPAPQNDDYYLNEAEYEILTEDELNALINEAVKVKEEKHEPLSKDDVQQLINETLDERDEKDGCECCADADEACCEDEVEEVKTVEDKKAAIPPIIVSIPTKIEEEEENVEEENAEEDRISEAELRELVKTQILEALKDVKVNEEIKEVRERRVVEAPKAAPAPVKSEEKATAKVVEPAPKAAPAKVVKAVPVAKKPLIKQPQVRGREEQLEKEEAEKKTFSERVVASEADIKLAYNEIKNLLVSYGLKDRISASGDTFRLHKVTYCKVTMGGSHLKIYLALDPKNYSGSALPISDASNKDAYKEIPLVFRVKSDLSLRRARDLITDMMRNHNVEQLMEVPNVDYVAEMKKELKKAAKEAAKK